MKEMLRDAKQGKFRTIVVFKIDRLSCSTYKLFGVMQDLKDSKVNVISVTEGLDTESRLSEGIFLMLGIVAGWEREGIVERINAGMERAKKNGTKSGRPIGRPRRRVNMQEIESIRQEEPEISQNALAKRLRIPRTTLQRVLKEA